MGDLLIDFQVKRRLYGNQGGGWRGAGGRGTMLCIFFLPCQINLWPTSALTLSRTCLRVQHLFLHYVRKQTANEGGGGKMQLGCCLASCFVTSRSVERILCVKNLNIGLVARCCVF